MAGLFYLPRLFVYHCNFESGSKSDNLFQIMERRLLKIIMNPAMIVTFITGIGMLHYIDFSNKWIHFKILLVIFMAIFHGFLAMWRKNFIAAKNHNSEKFYRIINEVPTILMILIVSLVVFKPF